MYICFNQNKSQECVFCFFFKSSDAVEWSGFFFNSLNKMTNAAYENAMRRCPRN